jgi:dTDP-4-amino-4,6-dideoxygalactose transaminase
MSTTIPLVDLAAQHEEVADEVAAGWARVVEAATFVGGEEVEAFEEELARFWGVAHAVGVGSGTDALEMVLRAACIGPGDEVVVPANSFVASAAVVARVGATPVFVDVDPVHLHLDVDALAERLGPATAAVMPVHLFGELAPLEDVAAVTEGRRILIVEDAAQAQGATRHGQASGRVGLAAATSFYPGKNLGAYGDAGAVLTNRSELAERVRLLGNHGSATRYEHRSLGFNSRLDPLQAVVLRAKLTRLDQWNEARRTAARRYDELLGDLPGVQLPATREGNEHVWHLYVVRMAERDRVLARLHREGVAAGIHYPVPLHLQGAFRALGHRTGDFPVAEASAARMLSLPLHPYITPDQQERIADLLRQEVS